jgi:HEAT repeat protein
VPVTIDQVLSQLNRDEPNYQEAVQLGPEALPHLLRLVQGGNPDIASKATYLAGFINADQSTAVVDLAARSSDLLVRIAAAASLGNLGEIPTSPAASLLDDQDPGVRRLTLESLQTRRPAGFKSKVQEIAAKDPDEIVRQVARQVVNHLP